MQLHPKLLIGPNYIWWMSVSTKTELYLGLPTAHEVMHAKSLLCMYRLPLTAQLAQEVPDRSNPPHESFLVSGNNKDDLKTYRYSFISGVIRIGPRCKIQTLFSLFSFLFFLFLFVCCRSKK